EGYPGEGYPGDASPGGGYQGRGDPRYGQGAPGGQPGWSGSDPGPDSGFLPGFGQGGAGGYPGYEDVEDRPRRGRRGRDDGPGGGGGGGGGDWDDDGGSGRRRSTIRRLAPWIALLVILTPLLIGGLYIYNIYENKYHPADYSGPGTSSVTVQVNSGDSASSLGPRLQSLGVVASARAFVLAAEHTTSTTSTGAPPQLEAGFYKLHMHMQASLAWAALLNPKNRVQLTVTIPEGKRASQVILILAKETSIPASQFQAVINSPAQLGLPSYAKGKVEGYLFPATYTIQPNETAAQILKAMVQRYGVEAQAINISSAARAVHLSSAQVIIEASLAQAEGGSVSDYPKIARVITNRLAIGMHLQFDSTVLYGLGKYAVSATIAETRTPGPYNTYLNAGLPVGPICNPGDAAIQAILHPASGNWLYFLTKPGGASEFSTTPLQGQ
ncbi:MAG TPA: endolytic transglycosylase MltG, partial [Trebonia sp.]|nr:endolytic transglycosylase MltG [Trebonia sp.]